MQGEHQGKPAALWIATIASALLLVAAHPPWSWWPAALVSTAPVAAVLLDPRARVPARRAGLAGALYGCVATWLLVGPWSVASARDFFGGSPAFAFAFAAALPLIASGVALHCAALFAALSRLAGLGAVAGVVGGAALWAAAELARTSLGQGNPWGSVAAALSAADALLSGARAQTPVADLLALGGAPFVAFVASAAGTSLGLAWCRRRFVVERGQALAAGAVVVAFSLAVSSAGRAFEPSRPPAAVPREPLRVALVQPGVGRSHPWQGQGAAEAFERHVEITRSFETKGADLVVWPENALPFLLDANPDRIDELRALAKERNAALLVGASRSAPSVAGRAEVFNSVYLFPADGSEAAVYDKRVLMPYVERVPSWIAPLLASPWRGAYAEGAGPGVFDVKGWRVAPLVCLEAVYPGEAARRVAEGADLLVNVSNDSWFDHGSGPEQHFALAALRAAETGRPLVRVATTGVSALVGADGLVSWRLPAGGGAVALLDVPPASRDTLFVRGGRVGVTLFLLLLAAAAVVLPGRRIAADAAARPQGGEKR